ncbi:uncharacterized protein PG998_011887 [Apiospora kogelbergensis]|uniref:uncharacterized protein n=1 Tax=Apiospora kogelbergensis TaxID=1337665 RepID=UPI00312EBDE0
MAYDVRTPAHEERVAKLDREVFDLRLEIGDWLLQNNSLSSERDGLAREVTRLQAANDTLQEALATQSDDAKTTIEALGDELAAERRDVDKVRREAAHDTRHLPVLRAAHAKLWADAALERATLQAAVRTRDAVADGLRRELGQAGAAYAAVAHDNAAWRRRLAHVEAERQALAAARDRDLAYVEDRATREVEVRDNLIHRMGQEYQELRQEARASSAEVTALRAELGEARLKVKAQTAQLEEQPKEQPEVYFVNSYDGTLVLASKGKLKRLPQGPFAAACDWASAEVDENEGCGEEIYAVNSYDGTPIVVLKGQQNQLLERPSVAACPWASANDVEDYDDMSDLVPAGGIAEEEFHSDSEEYEVESFYFAGGDDGEFFVEIPRPDTPYPPEVSESPIPTKRG